MAKTAACTDPSHHVHGAAAYVHAVEAACAERGLRLTPLRAQVLGLVADAGKPVKAYDLLDLMKSEGGSTCAAHGVPRASTSCSSRASSIALLRSTPSSPATIRRCGTRCPS
jgi:hypothetical protein